MFLEWGLFSSAAILVGWIGTTALAAHQIALQVATILFMIPFGISLAATVRVGHAVGRRDPAGTRRAGFAALALGAAVMTGVTLVIVALRHRIPPLFLADTASPDVVGLAAALLVIGATFFVSDGIQGIAAGALRGLNDTRIPMLFSALSFWAIGFASSYVLAFPLGLDTDGIWIGFSLGVTSYALLLVLRFQMLTARGYLPPLAEGGARPAAHG
jgi:MATE family multidrug resistance protein